jgi:hypothetical protein
MKDSMTILQSAAALSTDWLGDVLGAPVTGFTVAPLGFGQMGDSFRVGLTYADDAAGPPTVVLKVAAADETSRATGLALRIFEVEVRFYLELLPLVQAPVPTCLFGEVDVETGWFTLLLQDMAPAVQGDQLVGCSPAQAELALVELARLHASGWQRPELAAVGWLNRTTPASTAFTAAMISGLFPGFLERYADRLTARQAEICTRLVDRLAAYLADRSGPMTLVHGDYRLDNLLFEGADLVTVIDWQTATWGPAMVDASYFVACALADPAQRAELEQGLLRRYHDELVARGVEDYDWDTCWRDYRRLSFGTLVMAIASSMLVERTDRGDRMFLCSVERACAQVDHLDALELLP